MEREIELFNKYVSSYNLDDDKIDLKYNHSFRVMEFAKNIAVSLELNEDDIKLASLCGLLHDIGRFNQWTNYHTYNDHESLDHGDEGVRVLKNKNYIEEYTDNPEWIKTILLAVGNHNKSEIEDGLTESELLFCKITRDADKLDILEKQCLSINDSGYNDAIIKDLFNYKMCKNTDTITESDSVLRTIGWIFDINYKYSFDYLIDNKIIDYKLEILLEKNNTNEIIKLSKFIKEEIEKRKNLC